MYAGKSDYYTDAIRRWISVLTVFGEGKPRSGKRWGTYGYPDAHYL